MQGLAARGHPTILCVVPGGTQQTIDSTTLYFQLSGSLPRQVRGAGISVIN